MSKISDVKEGYISVMLYGDGSRNAHLRAEYIYCEKCNECSFYKHGNCFMVAPLFTSPCPIGRIVTVDGGTKASMKFRNLTIKVRADALYGALSYPSHRYIGRVGEDALFKVPYVSFEVEHERIIIKGPLMFSDPVMCVPRALLAPDTIYNIATLVPHTIFSYEPIKDYQDKIVPLLLEQIKTEFPDEFKKFLGAYPDYKVPEINYIGRRAKLITCNRDAEYKTDGGLFRFEGEYIVSDRYSSSFLPFMPLDRDPVKIKIKLNDKMVVKITSNDQVLPTTIFID